MGHGKCSEQSFNQNKLKKQTQLQLSNKTITIDPKKLVNNYLLAVTVCVSYNLFSPETIQAQHSKSLCYTEFSSFMSPYSKPVAAKTPSKNDWAGIQTVFTPCDIRECCPYIGITHTCFHHLATPWDAWTRKRKRNGHEEDHMVFKWINGTCSIEAN